MSEELTSEQELNLAGIAKCDNFLKNWAMGGYKRSERLCNLYANEMPPLKVVERFKKYNRELVDGGADESPDFHMVIFYANAKHGFILRLVAIHERENAFSMA